MNLECFPGRKDYMSHVLMSDTEVLIYLENVQDRDMFVVDN